MSLRARESRRTGVLADLAALWLSLSLTARLLTLAVIGAGEAAVVGYLTSKNPAAAPAHLAVTLRILIIVTLVGAGAYALSNRVQARMGAMLLGAGLYAGIWLLNGSSNRVLFSIGVLGSAGALVLYASLVLAHPDGRLHSLAERRFLWRVGGAFVALWIVTYVLTAQPPIRTPLLGCTPHCPSNALSIGVATRVGEPFKGLLVAAWLTLTYGSTILLYRRGRSASAPLRRSMTPVWIVAATSAVLLTVTLALRAANLHLASAFSAAYLEVSAVGLSLAILAGLGRERLFIAGALADFVNQLGGSSAADPQVLLAEAMSDPSLTIAYRRPGTGTYVSPLGEQLAELPANRAITWIERRGIPVAAVIYDPELAEQERFVHAAGSAALTQLEKVQLEADLRASVADLEASRVRLMETANLERRRLERDLHDGVQQQLTALRIKLDLVAEKVKEDAVEGLRMLYSVGNQMDGALQELRLLARGIYPSVLHDRGLVDALKSIAFNSPIPIVIRAIDVERYPEELEVAVYFCCLEAVQNIVKHAGPDAGATVHLWQNGPRLYFEVRDSGRGFDPAVAEAGAGLANMRDRIEAVGGELRITSAPGHRTMVRGTLPVA